MSGLSAVHETTSEHTDEILDFLERQSRDLQVTLCTKASLQSLILHPTHICLASACLSLI